MRIRALLFLLVTILTGSTLTGQNDGRVVRQAKLEIDPAQLEKYKAALKEEIETSVRVEPGVRALNAVAEKKNPTHITIFEIYVDDAAYQAHLQTPHFRKYKTETQAMVKALQLIETDPISLGGS